jgi:hypothetical protein
MSKKKIITVPVRDISPYEFEGNLSDLKTRIQEWIDQFGPTARIDWDPHFHYDYEQSPSPRFDIYVSREETDAEMAKREKEHKDYLDAIAKRDKAEYERLKKQFGEK